MHVFTNFPVFSDGCALIAEMVRVIRPGGRVLIGSIPDAAVQSAYEVRVAEVSRELEAKYGPRAPETTALREDGGVKPGVICFYFAAR